MSHLVAGAVRIFFWLATWEIKHFPALVVSVSPFLLPLSRLFRAFCQLLPCGGLVRLTPAWSGCTRFPFCMFSNIRINHTNKQYAAFLQLLFSTGICFPGKLRFSSSCRCVLKAVGISSRIKVRCVTVEVERGLVLACQGVLLELCYSSSPCNLSTAGNKETF